LAGASFGIAPAEVKQQTGGGQLQQPLEFFKNNVEFYVVIFQIDNVND
jgi:hypothetical protein